MTIIPNDFAAPMSLGTPFRGSIRRIWGAIKRRRSIAWTSRTLRDLPDHTLKDIGIHRTEIGSVCHLVNLKSRF